MRPAGCLRSYTDPLGRATKFTYTATQQNGFTFYDLTKIQFPDQTSVTLVRDGNGNVTSATDQAGQTWQSTWNSQGQVATTANPSGAVTTFTYDPDGTLTAVQLDSGDTSKYSYDSVSRPTEITYPDDATASGSTTRIVA